MDKLSSSAKKVQKFLEDLGLKGRVVELPDSTRTAIQAAEAIGCGVEQIVKSLVFKTSDSNMPILVVASGMNHVNEKMIAALCGESIEKADAEFVKEQTGFSIGGVPPAGHIETTGRRPHAQLQPLRRGRGDHEDHRRSRRRFVH